MRPPRTSTYTQPYSVHTVFLFHTTLFLPEEIVPIVEVS